MKKRLRVTRGQALVEFALVLPFFLLVLFGIVEFGRALLWSHNLANASRIGCRRATLPDATDADVQAAIGTFMDNIGFDSGDWVTTVEVRDPDDQLRAGGLTNAQYGDRVYVGIRMDFSLFRGSVDQQTGAFRGAQMSFPIRGRCVFRHE